MAAMPFVIQARSGAGNVAAGAKLYASVGGTSTPQEMYTTNVLDVATANPAIADAAGRLIVWLDTTKTYKLELYTSDDATRLIYLDGFVPSEDTILVALADINGALTLESLTLTGTMSVGGIITDTLELNGVTVDPSGATVGQALGFPNSSTTLEPYTPAGAGDTLKAANEPITGDWTFSGDVTFTKDITAPEAYGVTFNADGATDDEDNFIAALTAGGAGATLRLQGGKTYAVASFVDVTQDDAAIFLNNATVKALTGATALFSLKGKRDWIVGPGTLDANAICGVGVGMGIAESGGGLLGVTIKNFLSYGIQVVDAFGAEPDQKIVIKGCTFRWDDDKIEDVLAESVTPWVVFLQGTLTTDVENFEIEGCTFDFSNWTVEQITRMTSNPIAIRVNQNGTGFIQSTHKVKNNTIIWPWTNDPDKWDPTEWSNPDTGGHGRRRPTGIEMKTTTADQFLPGDIGPNTMYGGCLHYSFANAGAALTIAPGSRLELMSDYALEAVTCTRGVIAPDLYIDARYCGLYPFSTNGTPYLYAPGGEAILGAVTQRLFLNSSMKHVVMDGKKVRCTANPANLYLIQCAGLAHFSGRGMLIQQFGGGSRGVQVTSAGGVIDLTGTRFEGESGSGAGNAVRIEAAVDKLILRDVTGDADAGTYAATTAPTRVIVDGCQLSNLKDSDTFTPGPTFASPGTYGATWSTQLGKWKRTNGMVTLWIDLVSTNFTKGTASGNLIIPNIPILPALSSGFRVHGRLFFDGITKTNYTQFLARMEHNSATMQFVASGSGQPGAFVTAADMPTGPATVALSLEISYPEAGS